MAKHLSNNLWINIAGFQLAWLSAILLGNSGLLILLVLLVLHFVFHRSPGSEIVFVCGAGLAGFSIDTLLTLQGVFIFTEPGLPPLWLLLLWFCFSATLRQSLSFFQSRLPLAALCGGVCGALTYLAAARLGAFVPGLADMSLFLLIALIWSFLFPLLIWLGAQVGLREISDAY